MTRERAIDEVFSELRRAEEKFPGWPEDVVHGAAIVGEEAGELLQAALDQYYGRANDGEEVRKEAVQTAAMALRFLFNLEQVRACRVCGCTDDHACPGGCSWTERDLCSACEGQV